MLGTLLLLLAAAASPAPAPTAAPAPRPAAASTAAPARSPESYRVGSADVLRIEVFDDASLSGDFTVGADGNISFPLLGSVPVDGKSADEIRQQLTRLLEKDYLFDPKVAVTVKEYRSQKVRILGNVTKPGIYFLDGPLRLFDLVSRAEGISPAAGEIRRGQTARIVREGGAAAGPGAPPGPVTISVDLHDLLVAGKDEANVALRGGDVVYIGRSETIAVIGEVKRPGSYPWESGMTVLKAVGLAGGPTKKGSIGGAKVQRIRDGKKVEVDVKAEDPLSPDDVLEIPVSFW